jgi:hypothetical protein
MASVHLPARAPVTPAAKSALSFASDWHDHCETPFEAYRDVEPLLFQLAQRCGRSKAQLRIYDPYYCEGSMVRHLARLGFTDVYNRDEDCYAAWASGGAPDFDVLVTNPPYSGDHIRRCCDFAARCGRPWLLLLPSFVCRKRAYREVLAAAGAPPPAYLLPARRYVYYAPGRSAERTAPTSPFDSMWYMSLGDVAQADALLAWWDRKYAKASGCTLARTVEALPAELTPVRDEKRANPKARRRHEQYRKSRRFGRTAVGTPQRVAQSDHDFDWRFRCDLYHRFPDRGAYLGLSFGPDLRCSGGARARMPVADLGSAGQLLCGDEDFDVGRLCSGLSDYHVPAVALCGPWSLP